MKLGNPIDPALFRVNRGILWGGLNTAAVLQAKPWLGKYNYRRKIMDGLAGNPEMRHLIVEVLSRNEL